MAALVARLGLRLWLPLLHHLCALATFVGVLFNQLAGLSYEASAKAVLALSVLGSGWGMYGFVRSWLGRRAGLVAAVAA